MSKISIVGYENDDHCEHCNRPLVHCIRLDDGRLVGAQCFNKVLTKPVSYQGKTYRLGASKIIELAKIRQFWSEERRKRCGYYPISFEFELA